MQFTSILFTLAVTVGLVAAQPTSRQESPVEATYFKGAECTGTGVGGTPPPANSCFPIVAREGEVFSVKTTSLAPGCQAFYYTEGNCEGDALEGAVDQCLTVTSSLKSTYVSCPE